MTTRQWGYNKLQWLISLSAGVFTRSGLYPPEPNSESLRKLQNLPKPKWTGIDFLHTRPQT